MTAITNKLRYFNVETTLFSELPYKQLRRKYGCEGIALLVFLQTYIFREEGYFAEVTDDLIFDLSDELMICESRVLEIIAYCCEVGIFDQPTYKDHNVLTSVRIQQSYCEIYQRMRRKANLQSKPYCLLSAEEPAAETGQPASRARKSVRDNKKEAPDATVNPQQPLPGFEMKTMEEEGNATSTLQNLEEIVINDPRFVQKQGEIVQNDPQIVQNSPKKKIKEKKEKETLSSLSPLSDAERGEVGRESVDSRRLSGGTQSVAMPSARSLLYSAMASAAGSGGGSPSAPRPTVAAGGGGIDPAKAYESLMPPCAQTPCPEGRNYSGLIFELQRLKVPVEDAISIARLSNYGMIGGRVWQIIHQMRNTNTASFKKPGKYIISCLVRN